MTSGPINPVVDDFLVSHSSPKRIVSRFQYHSQFPCLDPYKGEFSLIHTMNHHTISCKLRLFALFETFFWWFEFPLSKPHIAFEVGVFGQLFRLLLMQPNSNLSHLTYSVPPIKDRFFSPLNHHLHPPRISHPSKLKTASLPLK